jgi:hypothetical protein
VTGPSEIKWEVKEVNRFGGVRTFAESGKGLERAVVSDTKIEGKE